MKYLNLCIVAHVDAGKTTLTEQILYESGIIRRVGRVDDGDTVADALAMEKKRGITIRESTLSFVRDDVTFNLLDTPGHADFAGEVQRAMTVADLAVLVVSAREGVQARTIAIHRALKEKGVPVVFFINKLDRIGADPQAALRDIEERLGARCLPMQRPHIHEKDIALQAWQDSPDLWEALALEAGEQRAEALDAFLAGEGPQSWGAEVAQAVRAGAFCPVYFGVALRGIGVAQLLDALVSFAPDPAQGEDAPASALVYKINRDAKGNKKTYFRLFQGEVRLRDELPCGDETVLVRNLETLHAGGLVKVQMVRAGEIGVMTAQTIPRVGDVLGVACARAQPPSGEEPALRCAVIPAQASQRRELIAALYQLAEEDPLLRCDISEKLQEIQIRIFGAIQREYIADLLQTRFGIAATLSQPATIYRETPCAAAQAHIGMNAREGDFAWAALGLAVAPLPCGSGCGYVSEISAGDLTRGFHSAIAQGVAQAMQEGPLGWELTDIAVTVREMEFSSVMSTPADFRDLAQKVVGKALAQAGTQRLEPLVHFELIVPNELCARAMHDMQKRGGEVTGIVAGHRETTLSGVASQEATLDYPVELASYSGSRGLLITKPGGYALRR